jgi:hypothetical protein
MFSKKKQNPTITISRFDRFQPSSGKADDIACICCFNVKTSTGIDKCFDVFLNAADVGMPSGWKLPAEKLVKMAYATVEEKISEMVMSSKDVELLDSDVVGMTYDPDSKSLKRNR